jgi:hypothetical protein
MTKQEEFLYIVQTAILANGINLSSQPDMVEKYRHVYSASGVLGLMDDVLWASERIPSSLSAFDAANEFCSFSLLNLREQEERANKHSVTVPHWFART